MSINRDFIWELESSGGLKTKGYVPKDSSGEVLGHSGVTIGAGVDFGSKDEKHFKNLGISDQLIQKIKPYFGLKKSEADSFLREHPLELTYGEAETLSIAEMDESIAVVKSRYNNIIGSSKKKFEELTVNQRTVICSVLFQYGNPSRVPTFWKYVTDQDWKKAEAELRNFGDSYKTRRNKEADLLAQ